MVTVISFDGEFCGLDIMIRFNSFLFRADTFSSRYGRILSDLLFSPILASRHGGRTVPLMSFVASLSYPSNNSVSILEI